MITDHSAMSVGPNRPFTGGVSAFKEKLVAGTTANGCEPDFAEKTFPQLEGFGSYGFPESNAASFALIAFASA